MKNIALKQFYKEFEQKWQYCIKAILQRIWTKMANYANKFWSEKNKRVSTSTVYVICDKDRHVAFVVLATKCFLKFSYEPDRYMWA